ncbi:MAG: choice-of-anchor Q domain-containing protein, partial [Nitrososphaerales archaeon]
TVTGSTLSCNGNGIFTDTGTTTVTDSTFSGNNASGVLNAGGNVNVTNSTIFSNSDSGIFNEGGTVNVTDSTISSNSFGINTSAGTVNLGTSILADNFGNCNGTITDNGYNIDDDSSCFFSATGSVNDSSNLDSHLGPLAYNGGLTETVALLPGSPAIDKVPAVDCPVTDQRGTPRTAPCDMGAYDTDGNNELPYLTLSGPPSATRWSPIQVTVTALNTNGTVDKGFSGTVSFTSTDSSAVLPASGTLTDGTGTFSVTFKTPGSQTLTASGPPLASGSQTFAVGDPVLALTTPANVTSGKSFSFSVRALNPNGTIDTGYPNMVDFSLANGSSTWTAPGPSKLTSGKKNFTAKLTGAGPQMIIATDSVDSSMTTKSNTIEVGSGF